MEIIDGLIYLVPGIPAVNRTLKSWAYIPKHGVKTFMSVIKKFVLKVLPKLGIGTYIATKLVNVISKLTGVFPFGVSIGGLLVWGLSKIRYTWKDYVKIFGWQSKRKVTYIRIF